MKSQFLPVMLLMLIAAACSNRDEIGQLQKSLDMEAAKVRLLTAGNNDIPIKKIKADEFSTTLYRQQWNHSI